MHETIRTPIFSRYELLDELGSGGMGTVYKARQKFVGRPVAFKVLPPGLRHDAEALQRFQREAGALGRLKHPHVVTVFDAGIEGGFPYLAMEFVEGEDLRKILQQRGRLSVEEVVRLGIEMAEALDHLASRGLVHRDVKPSNIIIDPDGRAVLTDFGIAFAATLPRITQGAMGTPEFMSPEQADGKELDIRTDLYSLGVVLYECLVGAVPFRREGESLTALNGLLHQILNDRPPRVTDHRGDVPSGLSDALARCLEKNPDDRFQTGAALAAALRAGTGSVPTPDAAPAVAAAPGGDTPSVRCDHRPVVPPGFADASGKTPDGLVLAETYFQCRPCGGFVKGHRLAAGADGTRRFGAHGLLYTPRREQAPNGKPFYAETPDGAWALVGRPVTPTPASEPSAAPTPKAPAARPSTSRARRKHAPAVEADAASELPEEQRDALAVRKQELKAALRAEKRRDAARLGALQVARGWLVAGLLLFGFLFFRYAQQLPMADWLLAFHALCLAPAVTGGLVARTAGKQERIGSGLVFGVALGLVFFWITSGLLFGLADSQALVSRFADDGFWVYTAWGVGAVGVSAAGTALVMGLRRLLAKKTTDDRPTTE